MVATMMRTVVLPEQPWLTRYEPDDEPLSNLIRRRMDELGYKTFMDLARAMARPEENIQSLASSISRWASGQVTKLDDDNVERLAAALRVTPRRVRVAGAMEGERQPVRPDSLVVGPYSEMPELVTILEAVLRNERVRRRLAADAVRYEAGEETELATDAERIVANQEADAEALRRKRVAREDQTDRKKRDERAGA